MRGTTTVLAAMALAVVVLSACGQTPAGHAELALSGFTCWDCHGGDYLETTNPNHSSRGFPEACETCHGTSAWQPAVAGDHSFWPLTGAHAEAACEACHADTWAGTPTECAGCHLPDYQAATDPNHVAENLPTRCEACHGTSAWQPATFDHAQFWPLEGEHANATCEQCHVAGADYADAPTDCVGCHREDYDGTTNPVHADTGFGTDCETCHGPSAWVPATFDHDAFWPLEGAHATTSCESCHVGGVYAGTPRECVGCHLGDYQTAEPDHVERGFDTNCVTCHTVAAWKPATFDHDQFWPLTGKHLTATCESCHVGGVYAGTPRDCEGCHRTDYDATTRPAHASVEIPANCTQCHDTDDWHTSTFPQHDRLFPITSGRHRNFGCADCHADAGDYSVFTCTGCHTGEHEISRMNRKHQGEVSGYQSTLDQYGVERGCYHCHPDGRADD